MSRAIRSYEASGVVRAAPEALFEALDDPRRLSRHMDQRSMAMMGSSMETTTDAGGGRTVGSVTSMHGRVLGLGVELDQVVTVREPPTYKAWQTVGEPRLWVIGSYRMAFRISRVEEGSRLAVSIDYDPPRGALARLLSAAVGRAYAKWCCERMVADAQEALEGASR